MTAMVTPIPATTTAKIASDAITRRAFIDPPSAQTAPRWPSAIAPTPSLVVFHAEPPKAFTTVYVDVSCPNESDGADSGF
jgi:hypothetical protein